MLIGCASDLCLTILGKERADVAEYCVVQVALVNDQVILTLSFILVKCVYTVEFPANNSGEFSNLM